MNIKPFYAEKTDTSQIKNLALVQDYLKGTNKAQRLSVNFRFNTRKVTLDTRGERDLGRVSLPTMDNRQPLKHENHGLIQL